MTREIKFRAWDERENKMVYTLTLEFDSQYNGLRMATPNHNWIVNNLMQYTGLKDKNGKEIYEGDIVRVVDAVDRPYMVNVQFDGETGAWHRYRDYRHSEVIGNVWEHPELLKGE